MDTKNFKSLTVGEIVAENFAAAHIFHRFGIDFCCNGNDSFDTACTKANADPTKVIEALESIVESTENNSPDFASWPMDLLIDYVLKTHHRDIRSRTPELRELAAKVVNAHGANHRELIEVQALLNESLTDLEEHLQKEEQVLFPYLYAFYDNLLAGEQPQPFHCGSVAFPIEVMEAEHSGEGERYRAIAKLTNEYTAPDDACGSYRLLLDRIRQFELDLHEHIHIENNIIFPRALQYEANYVGA